MKTYFENETSLLLKICDILNSQPYSSQYLEASQDNSSLTEFIPHMVDELANQMGLCHYCGNRNWDYYATDHVLYRSDEDQVPVGSLPNKTSTVKGCWLKRIRVAFEHENRMDGDKGGYQEIAHLMIVNADMKVLMGYAEYGDNYDDYARDYYWIYKSGEQQKSATPIVLIGEYGRLKEDGRQDLDAYVIATEGLFKYCWVKDEWSPMEP